MKKRRSRTSKFGELTLKDGTLGYEPGLVRSAWPHGAWSFRADRVRLVGEWTVPVGPVFDYHLFFVVADPLRAFDVPMECLECEEDVDEFFDRLSSALGQPLGSGLVNSVGPESVVTWPPDLAGLPLFETSDRPKKRGPRQRLFDELFGRDQLMLSSTLVKHLGGRPELPW